MQSKESSAFTIRPIHQRKDVMVSKPVTALHACRAGIISGVDGDTQTVENRVPELLGSDTDMKAKER